MVPKFVGMRPYGLLGAIRIGKMELPKMGLHITGLQKTETIQYLSKWIIN